MSQKITNETTSLVDYKELEANILSSIREGRPLMGRDGALTPFIKRLLEASLEGMERMGKLCERVQVHLNF